MKFPTLKSIGRFKIDPAWSYNLEQIHYLKKIEVKVLEEWIHVTATVDRETFRLVFSKDGVLKQVQKKFYDHDFIDLVGMYIEQWLCIEFLTQKEISLPFKKNHAKGFYSSKGKNLWESYLEFEKNEQINEIFERIFQDKFNYLRTQQDVRVHLEHQLELHKDGFYYIRFRIGTEKLYVLKNFERDLLRPLENGEAVQLGKNVVITLNKEWMSEEAKEILAFIQRQRNFWYTENAVYLAKENIVDYIETFNSFNDFPMTYLNDNIQLKVLNHANDRYLINVLVPNQLSVLPTSGSYFVFRDKAKKLFYKKAAKDDARLWEVLSFSMQDQITLTEEQFNFLKNLSEQTGSIYEWVEDDQWSLVPLPPKFYLDMIGEGNVSIRVENMERQSAFENMLDQWLFNHFQAEKNNEHFEYLIDQPKMAEAFITETLPRLSELGEVYVSDDLQSYSRPHRIPFKIGVSVSQGTIQLDFDSETIDLAELKQILTSYRQKKKFHRLKNGEHLVIHPKQFEALDQFLSELNLKHIPVRKEKVPTYRYYQLKDMPHEYFSIDFDEKFKAITDRKVLPIETSVRSFLRDYQLSGVQWLLTLRSMGLGGILADDMGLGKSLQLIAYLWSIQSQKKKPSLIVAPASLLYNWDAEFKKFNTPMNVQVITGNGNEREALITHSVLESDILITSYDYLRRDQDLYEAYHFDTIILDEAHYIKNHHTKTSSAVKNLKADYRFALTGTPIENTLAELWSIFDFLMPGYLYHYSHFNKHFEKPIIQASDEVKQSRLKQLVSPFILRRLKREVLTELPDKMEEAYIVNQTEDEIKLYQANLALANQMLNEQADLKQSSLQVLAMLTRLRQLSLDPRLLYENIQWPSSKIKAAIELIEQAIQSKQSILLFSSFTSGLDLVAQALQQANISYLKLTGQTSKEERRDYVERFQQGEVPVFLISLKAGGTGLNLTKASIVIHLDPWWNASAQNQATDRAYRIGQEQKVSVYRLVSKGTIEEKIEQLKLNKQAISDVFVENSNGAISQLSEDEIRDLFT